MILGASNVLRAQTVLGTNTGSAANQLLGRQMQAVGDCDGDGRTDFVVGTSFAAASTGVSGGGLVRLVSGATGVTIFSTPGTANLQQLGMAVARAGDANIDGVPDYAAGQTWFGPALPLPTTAPQPAVVIYSGLTGGVIRTLLAPAGTSEFGAAIANAGDRTGDGIDDFIVGSRSSSSAHLMNGFNGAVLLPFSGPAGSRFGNSVAALGDITGDGIGEFLIGASSATLGTVTSIGVAYIFDGANGAQLRTHNGTFAGDLFGSTLAAVPDVNADGVSDYCIGAPSGDWNGLVNVGVVHMFSGVSGALLWSLQGTQAYLSTSTSNLGETLGSSLAHAGDINIDGWPDVIVGASGHNGIAEDCGRADLVSGFDGSLLGRFEGSALDDGTGSGVASLGDSDSDGWGEVLVGTSRHDLPAMPDAGRVDILSYGPFLGGCAAGANTIVYLRVNGSLGGAAHRVDIALNAAINIEMVNLSMSPLPANFLLFAKVGVPGAPDITYIPGVGTMCFAPSLLAPWDPSLFLLASSFPTLPGLIPATSASWNSTIPGLAFPVRVTLQPVISFPPGSYWVGNAILANIR